MRLGRTHTTQPEDCHFDRKGEIFLTTLALLGVHSMRGFDIRSPHAAEWNAKFLSFGFAVRKLTCSM